jgi:hypothetical protein
VWKIDRSWDVFLGISRFRTRIDNDYIPALAQHLVQIPGVGFEGEFIAIMRHRANHFSIRPFI